MKPSLFVCVLIALTPLAGCYSAKSVAAADPAAAAKAAPADKFDYKKLGGVHAHHTPEQHAAFLKRVGQLPPDDEGGDSPGIGGGGGGGHHH